MTENLEPELIPLNSYAYQMGYKEGQKHPTDDVISDIITQFMNWVLDDEIHGIDMQAAVEFIKQENNGRN
jgi:hypothetical protein